MNTPVVTSERLTINLGDSTVIDDISFRLERNKWTSVIGPNGAGKTTLLRAMAGLIDYRGSIVVDGSEVHRLSSRERAFRIAYGPQDALTPSSIRVSDYVLLGRAPHWGRLGRSTSTDHDIADAAMRRLDLTPLARRPLQSLSGGERQRAVLAQALVQEAPILVLDEPTRSLDIGHQQQLLELIDLMRIEDHLTVVTSFHDLNVAIQYSHDLLMINNGKIVASGAAPELLTPELIASQYGVSTALTTIGDRPVVVVKRPPTT